MIDHREITFESSKIAGITLMQDRYLGLNIIAAVQGGHVVARLDGDVPFEASFLGPDEGPGPRFFIPDCELRFDHKAIADPQKDPPLGSLIVAKAGISLMVLPPRSGPSPLRLTGEAIANAYEGVPITKWRLQSSSKFGDPEIIFTFEQK